MSRHLLPVWPLAHGVAVQIDAIGGMYDTIEDGICDGRIADDLMPAIDRNLTSVPSQ